MIISKGCVELVKKFEGFSAVVYKDLVGVPTLGYGMTGSAIKGLTHVSEPLASTMLMNLINNSYALPISKDLALKKVVLNQNQFDALVCMAYNIGVGGLLGSTLYKNVVAGVRSRDIIVPNFKAWCKAGDKVIPGLLTRRTLEAELFLKPVVKQVVKPVVKQIVKTSGVVIVNSLNVRVSANATSTILGTLPKGATVKIAKRVGNFYSIYFGEHGGYVVSQYIK